MKTVTIWGSTGVIGSKALDIAIKSGFEIVAIISNSNYSKLIEQAKMANPKYVGVADKRAYEIVNQLAEWIKNKSGVGSKNMRACHIVVAYFIQNCEVFREISK